MRFGKIGRLQFTCPRASPKGTQNPGMIRSNGRSAFSGHGESGDASSM